jgi:excisionase family DNA binding protein
VGAEDLTERLLDTDEVAAWLNVTPAWVQEMARSGEMPAFKLGDRYWRFSRAQVARWLIERQERTYTRRTG